MRKVITASLVLAAAVTSVASAHLGLDANLVRQVADENVKRPTIQQLADENVKRPTTQLADENVKRPTSQMLADENVKRPTAPASSLA